MKQFRYDIKILFSFLISIFNIALLLINGVITSVTLWHIVDVTLLSILGDVLGCVDDLALFLVRRFALFLVDGVVNGVINRLVFCLTSVSVTSALGSLDYRKEDKCHQD